jgi:hypothetical protein
VTTFQEHFAENLSAFGWSVEPNEIPNADLVDAQLRWVSDWWHGLDATTRDILRVVDLCDGLWQAGKLNDWPGQHQLLSGLPFEHFTATHNNIISCFVRARNATQEQPETVSDVTEIVRTAGDVPEGGNGGQ